MFEDLEARLEHLEGEEIRANAEELGRAEREERGGVSQSGRVEERRRSRARMTTREKAPRCLIAKRACDKGHACVRSR